MTKKVGRPVKVFEWKTLDSILQFGARLLDCSEMIGLSDDTIQRQIKKKYGLSFSEYRDKKMSRMRIKLLQKQYDAAMQGSVPLLIWLGKNYLDQSDDPKNELKESIVINYSIAKNK